MSMEPPYGTPLVLAALTTLSLCFPLHAAAAPWFQARSVHACAPSPIAGVELVQQHHAAAPPQSGILLLICLAASFLGHVTSHSSSNGDVEWSFNAGSSATGTATLPTSGGRIDALVVATAAGSVHALSCADGILLWSAGFEGPVAVAAGQNPVVPLQHSFLVFS
jgi:hypothetical protein